MLSCVEHERSFITLRPGFCLNTEGKNSILTIMVKTNIYSVQPFVQKLFLNMLNEEGQKGGKPERGKKKEDTGLDKSFFFLHKNVCCGYSLEMPQWGASEYPQHLFLWRNKKNINTFGFFFFIIIWVLRPFQEYFTYIEQIVHQRWAKTREPRETTWPSVSRTWFSYMWPKLGSSHSGEKPNGLRVNSPIHQATGALPFGLEKASYLSRAKGRKKGQFIPSLCSRLDGTLLWTG